MSASAIPYRRAAPGWLKREGSDVCEQICKLAKKGLTPSQIGVVLRDSHGIAQVKSVTGNKVLRILKGNGEHRRVAACCRPAATALRNFRRVWHALCQMPSAGAAQRTHGAGLVCCRVWDSDPGGPVPPD